MAVTDNLLNTLIDNNVKVKRRRTVWVVTINQQEIIAFYSQSKLLHYLYDLAVQFYVKEKTFRGGDSIEIGQLVALM